MKKFTRQTSGNAPPANVNLDFCSSRREGRPLYLSQAATDLASTPPALFKTNRTFPVVLNLIEMEGGSRVDIRPLWVDGPNAGAGDLAVKNQHLIAQLLTLRELPTAGNVGATSFRNWRGWSSMRASYSPPDGRSWSNLQRAR